MLVGTGIELMFLKAKDKKCYKNQLDCCKKLLHNTETILNTCGRVGFFENIATCVDVELDKVEKYEGHNYSSDFYTF